MSEKKKMVPGLRFPGFSGEWEERKLEDITEFLDEQRKPLESSVREPGPYPYYGASGIIDYVKDYLFDEELILLSEDGANIIDRNYRVCFLARGKYWVNNHAHVLKSRLNYCNGFICESLERISYDKYNTGTAQPKLNQEVCRNIKIMTPDSKEQEIIASFFQKLDYLITLHQRQLTHLQARKKGLLQKMFPKDGELFPELRFPGFTDAWEKCELSEVVTVNSGRDYKHLNIGDIPVYGTGGYMLSVDEALSYDADGIGIGRKGTIDSPYILRAPYWTVDTLFYAIPKKYFDLDFTFTVFQNINWKKLDESTGVPSLSKTIINKVIRSFPTTQEQAKIGAFFKQLDDSITLHQRKLDHLQTRKKALLQQLFV